MKYYIVVVKLSLVIYFFSSVGVSLATTPTISTPPMLPLAHKTTATFTGINFGKKIPAAPLRYLDFEGEPNGKNVPNTENTGGLYVADGIVFDNSYQRFPGAQNAQQNFNNGRYNQTIGLNDANTITSDKLYIHGYWHIKTHGATSRNAKFINLAQSYGSGNWESRVDADNNSCGASPQTMTSLRPGCPQTTGTTYWGGNWSTMLGDDGKWHRLESYVELKPGYRSIRVDNHLWGELSTTDMTAGCSDTSIGYVYFGHYYDNSTCSPKPEAERWWDEMYIDTTQARVELCDSSQWASRSHCEIQIPSAWTDTSITFSVNKGSFTENENVYIFVVNENGEVSEGRKVAFGLLDTGDVLSAPDIPDFRLTLAEAPIVEEPGSYKEDFEGYPTGDNPGNWFDTGADNSLQPNDSLFVVGEINNNKSISTASTATNIHSHYIDSGINSLSSYEYAGRMMMTDPNGGIGVTFLSKYPYQDTYYRLRSYGSSDFNISPHGTSVSGDLNTGIMPLKNIWYRFRIQTDVMETRTEIKAKVWVEGTSEPANWQVEAYDATSTRLNSGTIGLWSMTAGNKYWDDLVVNPLQ